MNNLQPHALFDGYELIRPIGAGGFGQVWLCRSTSLDQLFAIKFVASSKNASGERELLAIQTFKQAGVANPYLMPIEHVGIREDFIFYVMPLADGTSGADPEQENWQPLTLELFIRQGKEAPAWFSSEEIRHCFSCLTQALEELAAAGLVHRDVKPENVLFLKGRPVLSDVSLLRHDAVTVTNIGTLGYSAPSWYVETGGSPDMYGLAATLFAMLTGNAPDKIGRAAFRWPPQGENAFSPSEHAEWLRLHRVIFRATEERASERFRTFEEFRNAINGQLDGVPTKSAPSHRPYLRYLLSGLAALLILGTGFIAIWNRKPGKNTPEPDALALDTPATSSASPIPQTNKPQANAQDPWAEFDREYALYEKDYEKTLEEMHKIEAIVEPKLEALKSLSISELFDTLWSVSVELDPHVQYYKKHINDSMKRGVKWRGELEGKLREATDLAEAMGLPLKGSRDREQKLVQAKFERLAFENQIYKWSQTLLNYIIKISKGPPIDPPKVSRVYTRAPKQPSSQELKDNPDAAMEEYAKKRSEWERKEMLAEKEYQDAQKTYNSTVDEWNKGSQKLYEKIYSLKWSL